MIFRNLIFEPEVVKQRLRAGMVSHHEQQASKCNGEQQHRALWPAYNLNITPPQASTEGLFQQTQAIALRMQVRPRPPLRIWRKNGSASACPDQLRSAKATPKQQGQHGVVSLGTHAIATSVFEHFGTLLR